MRTKDQGILGEGQAIAKFVEYGIPISLPFGDNVSYDLIAEFNGKLNKIQIKTSTQVADGRTTFELLKRRINSGESIRKKYTASEVDYYALYSLPRKTMYLVPFEKTNGAGQFTIRFIPPKNGQLYNVNMEEDYLIDIALKKIIQDEE